MDDSVITCDEIIESYNEEIKTIPTNGNGKNITCKTQFLYFTCLFINYHYIIDNWLYLLLSNIIEQNITILQHKS